MKEEIRAIITDQIMRHVPASKEHRAWLANDIATRIEAILKPCYEHIGLPGTAFQPNQKNTDYAKEFASCYEEFVKDSKRLTWMTETASGINFQTDHTGFISKEVIDKAIGRAEAEEAEDTKGEP